MKTKIPASPKLVISILIIAFSCYEVKAQKIKIGFRGGASFANFFNHNASGEVSGHITGIQLGSGLGVDIPVYNPNYNTNFFKDMRIGYFSGFYIDLKIANRWTLEMGLGFTQKGIDLRNATNSTAANVNNTTTKTQTELRCQLKSTYITLPVVFKYSIDKKQHFYLSGGIYTAYALKPKDFLCYQITHDKTYDSNGNVVSESIKTDSRERIFHHSIDIGLVGGGGFEIPLNQKWSAGIDIRINVGMVNIAGKYDQYGFMFFNRDSKNINIETGLRVSYRL